ncbi:MAG: hypothetical protein H7A34_04545 [bacterium]|nr:hypothetical protein [bacterium]
MISHFFIHASRAILNRQDLPSLILENINGRPLLHYQLERLTGLRFIQQVNIVTSDLDIDAPIVACAHSFKNERQLSFEVIRIPHSSDYAFRESNRIISDNFLYKMSLFGFLMPSI